MLEFEPLYTEISLQLQTLYGDTSVCIETHLFAQPLADRCELPVRDVLMHGGHFLLDLPEQLHCKRGAQRVGGEVPQRALGPAPEAYSEVKT